MPRPGPPRKRNMMWSITMWSLGVLLSILLAVAILTGRV